jgi:hypothetical protein
MNPPKPNLICNTNAKTIKENSPQHIDSTPYLIILTIAPQIEEILTST